MTSSRLSTALCAPAGLQHFLKMLAEKFICTLYTMGDEEYVKAVMAVIDPSNQYFTGATLAQPPVPHAPQAGQGRTAKSRQ